MPLLEVVAVSCIILAGLGAPIALAWWLSDGFAGFWSAPAGRISVAPTPIPGSSEVGYTVKNSASGTVIYVR